MSRQGELSIPRVLRHLLRMDLSEQPSSGAAQRRRQRRLRSWLRHERMTVAMARGQKNARAEVWGRDELHGHDPGSPPHVLQMVDQPLVLLAPSASSFPSRLSKCPRCRRLPAALARYSVPQTAEQLVEAPKIVSLIDVIRHPVEQTIGGGSGGLPGFSPRTMLFPFCGADRRQSSSSFSSWFWWRSSRFTPRTEFYSVW